MGEYTIIGGNRLQGEVDIQGSKNSVLPILAATILNCNQSRISNCPNIIDVTAMINILKKLGCKADLKDNVVSIDSKNMNIGIIPEDLVKVMRCSITLLGPILSRFKKVRIAFPGGCSIGLRPIDIHIKSLKLLGAKIIEKQGYLYCEANKLKGNKIFLDFPSVGATENIMLAATMAEGETIISNAAKEPEIVDLQNFINKMGANIVGAGTDTIKIKGVKKLKEAEYEIIPDRIVAGTYMFAAAVTGGHVILNNVEVTHLDGIISKMKETSCIINEYKNKLEIIAPEKLLSVDKIITQIYPGFPTDMQAQAMVALTVAKGTSIITETIFESRYKHIAELIKMGADITVDGRMAVIRGVGNIDGALVEAKDLRGGAALVLAGLAAQGTTTVLNSHFIQRGYEDIARDLAQLGADIKYVD